MPGTGGQHRKTEARFIQVKPCNLPPSGSPSLQTRGRKSGLKDVLLTQSAQSKRKVRNVKNFNTLRS